jgi:hypothetical protein
MKGKLRNQKERDHTNNNPASSKKGRTVNPLTQFKNTTTPPLLLSLLVDFFGLCEMAQAVVPAPDGGYPGGNTAEGQNALLSLTTGGFNTAIGYFSLRSNAVNSFNTAVGAGALLANSGDPNDGFGQENTATGAGALLSNTTGTANTANGAFALFNNTTGFYNTANGVNALLGNTDGFSNSAFGWSALASNFTGNSNTATGESALFRNTFGSGNTAIGSGSLASNTEGGENTAIGFGALVSNTTGGSNTALGHFAGNQVSTASNVIAIGTPGLNVSNSCFIGNIFGVPSSGGTFVFVDADGKLGAAASSKRFKDNIKPMDHASEAILALKPVSFRYKKEIDAAGTSQFGLVAEDVEKVNPNLVVRDKEGKPDSVRYEAANAMLLNEFLKEHRTVQELEGTVAQQQKEIQALTASLKEQAAQIQTVSAQLKMSKPAPQMVINNP